MGAPERLGRVYIDEGDLALRILRRAAARGAQSVYASTLLSMSSQRSALIAASIGRNDTAGALLTHRESHVLALIGDGKSNGEIGAVLDLSEWTVKKHITNIYRKLGVANRAQAIEVGRQRGLV